MSTRTYVHEAEIRLDEGTDPRAVGGAVTVALCGHWDHEGPCRWPHNNEESGGRFRTVFVAPEHEEAEVRRLIRAALRGSSEWRVISDGARSVAPDEEALAASLLAAPRRPSAG